MNEIRLAYGHEEDDFFYEHVRRDAPYDCFPHFHGSYEIYCLLAGRRHYFIKNRSYDVQEGDLIFIDRLDAHQTSDFGDPGHERIVINFRDAFLTGGAEHPIVPALAFDAFRESGRLLRPKPDERAFAESLLGRMAGELTRRDAGWESYVRLLLAELLLFAVRRMNDRPAEESTHPMHRKIAEIVRHIDRHYAGRLDLTAIANDFYVSPPYLSRSFRKVTGFTLTAYVHFARVRAAQRLLRDTGGRMIAIAETAGFESLAQFNRIFKRVAGMTPSAYRSRLNM